MFDSYTEVNQWMGKKTSRPATHGRSTRIERRDSGGIAVKYHDTDVVTYYPDKIVLNSGGYHTVTTKARINEYAHINVYSERGMWYVSKRGNWDVRVTYRDGLALSWSGDVLNVDIAAEAAESVRVKSLLDSIRKYAKLVESAYAKGEIGVPGGGDCWYCFFMTDNGQTMGEASGNTDHLISHMQERYVVPSLVLHALKSGGGSVASIDVLLNHDASVFWRDREWLAKQVAGRVSRYLKLQLGV